MKRQKVITNEFARFLRESGGVYGALGDFKLNHKPIRLFYGETVDEFGMPIDCLKYYFTLSNLQKKLSAVATVVVADTASFMNDSTVQKREHIRSSLNSRIELLNKIIAVYRLPIKIRLMSEQFMTDEYKKLRAEIAKVDLKVIEPLLSKTILPNKLAEERKKKFGYALDAVATGLLFDMKIGPPRERFYDEAGEKIMPGKLKSIYLTPTQPLGKNFAFFLTHPEIEEYGVTPYKAGSNKLQDFRIILGETSFIRAKELLETSFESENPDTVHPVKDIHAITEMAREFLGVKISKDTLSQLRECIYTPLGLEGI